MPPKPKHKRKPPAKKKHVGDGGLSVDDLIAGRMGAMNLNIGTALNSIDLPLSGAHSGQRHNPLPGLTVVINMSDHKDRSPQVSLSPGEDPMSAPKERSFRSTETQTMSAMSAMSAPKERSLKSTETQTMSASGAQSVSTQAPGPMEFFGAPVAAPKTRRPKQEIARAQRVQGQGLSHLADSILNGVPPAPLVTPGRSDRFQLDLTKRRAHTVGKQYERQVQERGRAYWAPIVHKEAVAAFQKHTETKRNPPRETQAHKPTQRFKINQINRAGGHPK